MLHVPNLPSLPALCPTQPVLGNTTCVFIPVLSTVTSYMLSK